jgi:hypothetical protein
MFPSSSSPSRRALLTGVVGGIGAWVLGAVGRASPAQAADGDIIHVGDSLTGITSTKITNSTTGGFGLWGVAPAGAGVYGSGTAGVGVRGDSTDSDGVFGFSTNGPGVGATSTGSNGIEAASVASGHAGILGQSTNDATGVQGFSGSGGMPPAAKPMTGVFGYAAQGTSSRGVWGESTAGIGLYGRATTGFAGYFHGKVFTDSFLELLEIATPAAPGANRARLFVRDSAGKTQLCVRFPTGTVKVLATES